MSTHFRVTPLWSWTKNHGIAFEWCSMTVVTISSPFFSGPFSPHAYATVLRDSVVPRVNTISFASFAWRKDAIFSRAPS